MKTKMRTPILSFVFVLLLGMLSHAASEEKDLPRSVDLRPKFEEWKLPMPVQGSRYTCSVFTVVGGIEFAVGKHGGESRTLSAEYLNWAKNKQANSQNDGGFFSVIWRGFRTHGICELPAMPNRDKFDAKLEPDDAAKENAAKIKEIPLAMNWIKRWDPKTGLTEEQFQAIKQTLADGWPVCVGLRWPIRNAIKNKTLRMVPPEEVRDGHSVLFVGYRDDPEQPGGGVFLLRDSDAPDPASEEFMPYEYARNYANDALFIDLSRERR